MVEFCGQTKSPLADLPAGFCDSRSLALLLQAIAVRRHGMSMMMVMTMMADALHLFQTLKVHPLPCQIMLRENLFAVGFNAA
jgi:hypothetical protein